MTYYELGSGLTLVVLPGMPDNPGFITYYPSILDDSTASADALLQEDSAKSFMQTQWRLSAENLLGMGAIASGWA